MLPGATSVRSKRERYKVGGRTAEIQRLIGRSLRAVVDTKLLGERSVLIDCDVIQADGGTRTASITGAFVALTQALLKLKEAGKISKFPIQDFLAATSLGIVDGEMRLDLEYTEDSKADVDMNLVMTSSGKIVEIQNTAEKVPFSKDTLDGMFELGWKGIQSLIQIQKSIIRLP